MQVSNTSAADDVVKSYYSSWRTVNSDTNSPFVALYSSFKDKHLATLDAGPLKLYLYFSFHANNTNGHSWHSIQRIASFFDTQTRTIDNWIKVLVDKELIYRERTDKLSNTTFLIPYSNTILFQRPTKKYESDSQELLDDLISLIKSREFLYGEIIDVYHLFQWNPKKDTTVKENTQFLVILTKRKNGIIIGHFYELKKMTEYGVSDLEIDDLAYFSSSFQFKGANVKGIALNHLTPVKYKKNTKVLLDLCEQIVQAQGEDFELLPQAEIEYGPIATVLEETIETEKVNKRRKLKK